MGFGHRGDHVLMLIRMRRGEIGRRRGGRVERPHHGAVAFARCSVVGGDDREIGRERISTNCGRLPYGKGCSKKATAIVDFSGLDLDGYLSAVALETFVGRAVPG